MKKYILGTMLVAAVIGLSSCNDWLTEESPGVTKLEDYFSSGATALQSINGCYTPLAWEYNNGYYSEWYFGDIPSDDALKGGQDVSDGPDAYDIDNFKVNVSNGIVLQYYRAKYQGISRCNLVLRDAVHVVPDSVMEQKRKDCLMGEAHFLRGFYYFQLVRLFGGVPKIDFVIDSSSKWSQPRATIDEIYDLIVSDFEAAEKVLYGKEQYKPEDLGRATKGAAQAMLCKANLYRGNYVKAYEWGKKFVDEQYKAGKYSLCQVYADNFTLAGENGPESVFEIQYCEDGMSDYGEGNGFTRGTFTTILVRPRFGTNKGWGWDHPTQNLYDEFEEGDPRREVTIGVPPVWEQTNSEVNYLGNTYYNNKYAYMANPYGGIELAHDSRSPLNYKLVRTSDVLLLFAEAALESGHTDDAKWALEEVRNRARQNSADPATVLPEFPNYRGYSDNAESLRQAIRHERRVELAMEGHRWFDIVRWGIAYELMNSQTGTYATTETEEARAEMGNFVRGKNELFPIPLEEIQLNPMDQNPGY